MSNRTRRRKPSTTQPDAPEPTLPDEVRVPNGAENDITVRGSVVDGEGRIQLLGRDLTLHEAEILAGALQDVCLRTMLDAWSTR